MLDVLSTCFARDMHRRMFIKFLQKDVRTGKWFVSNERYVISCEDLAMSDKKYRMLTGIIFWNLWVLEEK